MRATDNIKKISRSGAEKLTLLFSSHWMSDDVTKLYYYYTGNVNTNGNRKSEYGDETSVRKYDQSEALFYFVTTSWSC